MPHIITESEVEEAALEILEGLGYTIVHGPDIAPEGRSPERQGYSDVILVSRLRDAIDRLNPTIPAEAKEEAIKQILRSESPDLLTNNRRFHKMLTDGVSVEYRLPSPQPSPGGRGGETGRIVHDIVRLFDFENPGSAKNEFLAINQFTVIENNHNRRPDIVLFINGLPLVIIELKNPADENATVLGAFKQFQTYKAEIPSIFHFNEILVASDGFDAKAGTITSDWERFQPWKTFPHPNPLPVGEGKMRGDAMPQIEVLLKGIVRNIFKETIFGRMILSFQDFFEANATF